ncbi:hypothetical protein M2318_004836 [Metapseudomonas resinovorans]|uniref:LamG domain-containing protein n=1 Tax=Metapseudomonas resinovorans TaxID=53412 RepID=UPI003D1BDDEB
MIPGITAGQMLERDPHWANVVALLHFDGTAGSTTFTDLKGKTWSPVGNAQLSTTSQKFGTACLLLDGNGDGVSTPTHVDFEFGSGDFTIEFFFRPAAAASAIVALFERWNVYGVYMNATADGRVYAGAQNSSSGNKSVVEAVSTWTAGTWAHLAFVRSGSNLMLFKDGVLLGTATGFVGAIDAISEAPALGYDNSGVRHFNGRIDEFRITKGVARYTVSFTPPGAPFPNS